MLTSAPSAAPSTAYSRLLPYQRPYSPPSMANRSVRFRTKEKSVSDRTLLLNRASRFLVDARTSHSTGSRVYSTETPTTRLTTERPSRRGRSGDAVRDAVDVLIGRPPRPRRRDWSSG